MLPVKNMLPSKGGQPLDENLEVLCMKRVISVLFVLTMLFAGCSTGGNGGSYQQISQEEAKEMMDT